MAAERTVDAYVAALPETDLSVCDADDLASVAASLNNRPRQTLGYLKPSEKFTGLVAMTA
jgi:transposase, IS30 family